MTCLLILIQICLLFAGVCSDFLLNDNEVTSIMLPGGGNTTTLAHNVQASTVDVKYVVLEIHTQVMNVSLSWSRDYPYEATVTGRDVGVIVPHVIFSHGMKAIRLSWFVKTNANEWLKTFVLVRYLSRNDPIPGGCNQIFNLQNDPNLLLSYSNYWTSVEYQWANIKELKSCESSSNQGKLEYDVYVYFMKEASLNEASYDVAIQKMMGRDNIIKNGRKIMTMKNDKKTKSNFTLSSTNGQGAIYGVIVRLTTTQTSASYISGVSYGCNMFNQTCNTGIGEVDYVIGALCGIIGLVLCFFGHKCLKTEFFIMGFLQWSIISFLLLSIFTSFTNSVILLILSCLAGLIGGGCMVVFWWFLGIPVLSVLFVGFLGGYLFSAVLFFTPFGNLDVWQTEINYWMAFTCGLLLYPLVLLCFTKTLNIITSAFIGSFLFSIFVDVILHTKLKLIILNNFNKAIIEDYIKIKVVTPFQLNDMIMVALWFVLLIAGVVFQFYQSKGHAPFPPCPRVLRKRRLEQERTRLRVLNEIDDERLPLLTEQPPSYSEGPPSYAEGPPSYAEVQPPERQRNHLK